MGWDALGPFAFFALALAALVANAGEGDVASLPLLPRRGPAPPTDWLLDPSPYKAGVYRTNHPQEIALDNGLVRRTFRLAPNGATVGLENLVTGQALLRAVKPEAAVTINSKRYAVGGLSGQPDPT